MSASTYDRPSRVELELLARAAAAAAATPRERGRERALRLTGRIVTGLAAVAVAVGLLDVVLLLNGV